MREPVDRQICVIGPGPFARKERELVTAFRVFTDTEPLLVMASRAAVSTGRLVDGLVDKSIHRFIAHEVPLEYLRNEYRAAVEMIETDFRSGEDIGVLDSKGSRVFREVLFSDLEQPVRHDSASVGSMAHRLYASHA